MSELSETRSCVPCVVRCQLLLQQQEAIDAQGGWHDFAICYIGGSGGYRTQLAWIDEAITEAPLLDFWLH